MSRDTTHLPVWPRLSLPLSVFGFGLVLRVVVGPCFLGGFSCCSFGVFPRGFFLVFAFFRFFSLVFSVGSESGRFDGLRQV